MPVNHELLPASTREPAESLPQSTFPTASLARPCAELRADNRAMWLPAPDACNEPAGATPHDVPSTPSLPAEGAGPYAKGTWSADAAPATDRASPPPVHGLDRVMLLKLHLVSIPRSNRRSGDCAQASTHPAGLS